MSEFHPPNDDKSVTQSEALPTMGGDSHPNDGDMNHNDSSSNYEVLANTTSNTHHHPPHPEEVAAPWGSNPSTNMAYSNPHHRAPPPPPPPPHGSYHLPPPHEPHHHPHHGGYHPPYGSSPHYAYPPHDSHYHPPPPHHPPPPPPSHHPSVHHYPPKYSHHPHSSQMYHHPGYYQHPPPPPPQYHHHHYPPQHHLQHGMPPHGSYPPPPHYSSVPPQDVSPHNHRDDTHHVNESMPPKHSMNNPTEHQQYDPLPSQQVNMVTPTINSATTPGATCATNYSPNTTSPPPNTNDSNATTTQDDIMNSPATKELFASTPHHLSTNPTTTSTTNPTTTSTTASTTGSGGGNFNRSGMYKHRKQQHAVHKSILSKGLLPLDYDKNDDLVICGFEDSLLLPVARYDDDGRVDEEEELGRHQHGGVASNISSVAATAANTAAQLSGDGSTYTSFQSTTSEPTITGGGTTNKVTSPHQMEEIKSLSNQARAQIAKMKRMGKKQVQQVESQRVADIACEDNERYASSADDESSNNVDAACDGATEQHTTKAAKKSTQQKRYKDKDGFIYYRRVGNKHYKKLFEKGLVPKGDDGDSEDAKVVERVNAIQTITTSTDGVLVESGCEVPVVHQLDGGEDIGGVLNRRGLEERVEEGEVLEESMEQEQNLQLPRSRQTQLLYCNQQKRPVNASDGYELRVVPHEDGNDFHVELIKPDAEKVESVKPSAEEKDVEGATSSSSSPSVESEKLSENVEEGTAGGSKKNVGEFVSAVDSILDAAETIAKRDTPRSSPVTLPQSQHQQTENFSLPGISSLTKRKCADMIQGYQEEKRQRSNSSVAFNPCTYTAPSTFSYHPPDTVRPSPPHERVAEPSPQSHAAGPASNHTYSQIICQDRKEKRGRRTYCYPHPSVDLTEYYSSRQVTKTKKEELTALALCAASHIQKEPVLFRAILLNMALERERDSPKRHSGGAPTHLKNLALKRLSSQNLDGSATDTAFMSAVESSGKKVIRDGFFWKDVPELEKVLQTHMMEYYFMSENRPQSKKQQQFNNRLVSLVYQEAIARGFVFDPVSFSLEGHGPLDFPSTTTPIECAGNWIVPPGFNHKKLRDRIRCYYKTHVQNSKKRLGTLLKNPIKERNRDILLRLVNELKSQEHVELSPECVVALKRLKVEQDSIKGTVSTPDGTSPSSYETSSHSSAGYIGDHSQQTTTPYSSRATISDGGSGSSSSTAHSVQTPHAAAHQPASTTFSPFKHASLLSSMRQLDSQRH